MRLLPTSLRGASLLALFATATAERMLQSTSLAPCMASSGFEASKFNITFSPDEEKIYVDLKADSMISGMVRAKVAVRAYGIQVIEMDLNPCDPKYGLTQMCPMSVAPFDIDTVFPIEGGQEMINQIPGIAYQVPDLDVVAEMHVYRTDTNTLVACVEAPMTNGLTVEQEGVGWATAVIAGLALIVSAIISGLGHNWTAAHVAANALSLFAYFQAQAMVSLVAVPLPPIVAAYTQNYDWALGIIRIGFMQQILHWYIQATGGTPSNLETQQEELSVNIARRSLPHQSRANMWGFSDYPSSLARRAVGLLPRTNADAVPDDVKTPPKITGIERMAFKADIEHTNFFITGLAFFVAFICLVALGVAAFRWICIPLVHKHMKSDSFRDFRARWQLILRGIMYRIVLIGFPQMMILCPYEWTAKDSPAAVVLAVFFFIAMVGIMCFACFKVLSLGLASRRLDASTQQTAYKLYNDPGALNRWGYLYVQFRRPAFYFIVPVLIHALIKSFLIALMQKVGKAQAVALLVLELAYLIAVCVYRPWLDKRTNIVNIAIAVVNFFNSIAILIFSGITTAPDPVLGILGVIMTLVNAIFTLVLLILVLVSAGMAIFSKNPEKRFQAAPGASFHEKPPSSNIRDLEDDDVPGPLPQERRESVNTEQAMSIRNTGDERVAPIAGDLRPNPNPGEGWRPASPNPRPQTGFIGQQSGPVNWQSGVGYERQ